MRKKIWRMSEDQFDIQIPELKISCERIEIDALANEAVRSQFLMESTNGIAFRGVCYSTNPYIRIIHPQFEGVSCEVEFEVNNQGFLEGDVLEGEFCIVVNGTETRLPFSIRFQHRFPKSSVGWIDSDEQFARLAKEHWNEAMQLFYSERMRLFIEALPVERVLLYRGFAKGIPTAANLESYLVAAKSKEPVIFSLDESDREYYYLTENQRETIEITRSNWGHIDIHVACDADFISVDQERITADFFMGSRMQLSMYIHANRLHAGKNYACITFSSDNAQQEIHITASAEGKEEEFIPASILRGKRLIKLTQLYKQYRFEKISSAEWVAKTIEILEPLIEDEEDPILFLLMKAHVLIVGSDKQGALWIIQQLRREIEDRKSVEWAYLLYLCTLIEQEEDYVDRLVKEIELIFVERADEPMIFWFLLFLRKEYIDDYKRRLADIRRFMMDGENSPFFYVEANYLLRQEPYLITKFDEFSLLVLQWMLHQGQLTGQLADQISYVLEGERHFSEKVFALVTSCFDLFPSDSFLSNIVTYLLRNHKYGLSYLTWYERAIQKEMNFTGLYEAYILSLPMDYPDALPQMVIMYFRYQNTLPVEKKAFVYANVIIHQRSQVRIYEQYIRHMEEFALDMVRKRRIDDNLAVIYQHIFIERGLVDDEIADMLGDILFYDKVFGLDSDITRVLVYQEQLAQPIVAAVHDHVAYVPIYSREYRIFLEDRNGCLRCDPSEYYVEHLMQPGRAYRKLYEKATQRLHYFLYDLGQKNREDFLLPVDIPDVLEFLEAEEVDEQYKHQIYPLLIQYISEHGHQEELENTFRHIPSLEGLDTRTITFLTELEIQEGDYDRAYDLLLSSNGSLVSGKLLLKLCTHRIQSNGDRAEDFLIGLSCQLMRRYLSSEETITYLNRFLIGPTADMVMLWQFASARSMETRALEERILTQMLFTENIDVDSEAVYSSYLAHHPNRMLKDAYMTYFSQKYLMEQRHIPERIFSDALHMVCKEEPVNESIKISLMKHLSEKDRLNHDEYTAVERMLGDFIPSGVYFAFFKEFDRRLIVRYHLYDKTFVEYESERGRHLLLRFQKNDKSPETVEMTEMYPGIYVRAFVMFFGDKLSYSIVDAAEEVPLKEEEITFVSMLNEGHMSRYERLNAMQSAFLYSNEKELITDMKEYKKLMGITEKLFSML